jgi:hypothetical protein
MTEKDKKALIEKIKSAIKISSQRLIERKKALGQTIVISEEGKIRVVKP